MAKCKDEAVSTYPHNKEPGSAKKETSRPHNFIMITYQDNNILMFTTGSSGISTAVFLSILRITQFLILWLSISYDIF